MRCTRMTPGYCTLSALPTLPVTQMDTLASVPWWLPMTGRTPDSVSCYFWELVDAAKADGLDEIYSIESAGNNAIDHVARELGFDCKADPHDYTTLRYSLQLH